jgi:hypothetical protein
VKYLEIASAGMHRFKRFQHLEVFESLPQGERAGVFLKDSKLEKAQKELDLQRSRRKQEAKYLEVCKRCCMFAPQEDAFRGENHLR